MHYTGRRIIVRQDTNINSPTYGQTKQEIVDDLAGCSYEPLLDEDGYDTNPGSHYSGRQFTVEDSGVQFPVYIECHKVVYNPEVEGNDGRLSVWLWDYDTQTTTGPVVVDDLDDYAVALEGYPWSIVCPLPDTDPRWVETDRQPDTEIYVPSGYEGPDHNGATIVTSVDSNIYSPTYGHTSTETVTTDTWIPVVTPKWIPIDGGRFLYDINIYSSTYHSKRINTNLNHIAFSVNDFTATTGIYDSLDRVGYFSDVELLDGFYSYNNDKTLSSNNSLSVEDGTRDDDVIYIELAGLDIASSFGLDNFTGLKILNVETLQDKFDTYTLSLSGCTSLSEIAFNGWDRASVSDFMVNSGADSLGVWSVSIRPDGLVGSAILTGHESNDIIFYTTDDEPYTTDDERLIVVRNSLFMINNH